MVSLASRILKQTVRGHSFSDTWTALLCICSYSVHTQFQPQHFQHLQTTPRAPVSQTQVRWISKKKYQFPEINEADLQESFVRGSGPGGQKVNKTANCVLLKHKPSGLQVKCQDGRSLVNNRRIARLQLQYNLDIKLNGDKSFDAISKKEKFEKRQSDRQKSKKLLEKKKAFKEREGLK